MALTSINSTNPVAGLHTSPAKACAHGLWFLRT